MNGILRKKCFIINCCQLPDGTLIPINPDNLTGIGLIPGNEIHGTIIDTPLPINTHPNEISQKLTLITTHSFIPAPTIIISEEDLHKFQPHKE